MVMLPDDSQIGGGGGLLGGLISREGATGVRLIAVQNPAPGILLARFNQPVEHDSALLDVNNWIVRSLDGEGQPLVITEATGNPGQPKTVLLRYRGSGRRFSLTVINARARGESEEGLFGR